MAPSGRRGSFLERNLHFIVGRRKGAVGAQFPISTNASFPHCIVLFSLKIKSRDWHSYSWRTHISLSISENLHDEKGLYWCVNARTEPLVYFHGKLSRCVAKQQSSKPRESSCVQISDRVRLQVLRKKHTFFLHQHIEFFWPRTISHLPPTIPKSLMQIGPAISEIMMDHQLYSTILGYQSLARYRSLGFEQCSFTTISNFIQQCKCYSVP